MRAALALGRRSMGRAAPNPAVGALVVRDGCIIGRGVTAPGGRPHAEPVALAQAGASARDATLYVTLEPCSHFGRTPPCVDAVIASGVTRVVVALRDPDPRVAGRGLARLEAAGIVVTSGVCEDQARRDHLGHILRVTTSRPTVTLKMAETADGFAGAPPGQDRLLITGPQANAAVHRLRSLHDAVMVGRGTAIADDPLLTVRLPGSIANPLRIVLDSEAALSPTSRLVQTARNYPLLVVASSRAPVSAVARLEAQGVEVCRLPLDTLVIADVLVELGRRGVTRLFCEGGPHLASALIDAEAVDRLYLFTGSASLAEPGRPAFTAAARERIADRHLFNLIEEAYCGSDRMRLFERVDAACSPGS